jgi:plasmid maintenance system antidote protein VapI
VAQNLIKMKQYTLSELEDRYIGKKGTPERDEYEYELRMELLARMIKKTRQARGLTQDALSELVGVKKSQISKLENHTNSATMDTIFKVFRALKAEVQFNVRLDNQPVQLA